MAKIKITEEELKQIVNESVKRVLKEDSFFNMEGGYNAMKNNLGQTKGQGFGTRLAKAVTAGNQGYKVNKVKGLIYDLKSAFSELQHTGMISNEEFEELHGKLSEILEMLYNRQESMGLKS